jgi:hypothetical protein
MQDTLAHLCNVSVADWEKVQHRVPESITGREFLDTFGSHSDPFTTLDVNARSAPYFELLVCGTTCASSHEHRCASFCALLQHPHHMM